MKNLTNSFLYLYFKKKKDSSRKEKLAKEHYEEFLGRTKKLQEERGSERKSIYAKTRGKYLQIKNNYCYFTDYKNFCDDYRKVAQKRGKLIAQIKGIEKEKREALQTQFWALIYSNKEEKTTLAYS